MLCRVADSLFWMSRYIERAESAVRLLDVNLQILLETDRTSTSSIESFWKPIIASTGDLGLFKENYDELNSETAMDFLTFSDKNPSSVLSCIKFARENARMIRDQISEDMWEIINRLYLNLKRADHKKIWKSGPHDFYKEIREYSNLFQGVTDSTFLHGDGFDFIKAGMFLERADKTGQILKAKQLMDAEWAEKDETNPLAIAQWVSVLRACSAEEVYQQIYVTDIIPKNVIEFLVLSREFPRSILFSATKLQFHIHAISDCPTTHYSNEAERLCGKLIADLTYSSVNEIFERGLDDLLDHIHRTITKIAIELNNAYMFFPIIDPAQEQKQTTI